MKRNKGLKYFKLNKIALLFGLQYKLSSGAKEAQLVIIYSLLQGKQNLKYPNACLSVVLKKGFLRIWLYKTNKRGVSRVYLTTASVMRR